MAQSIIDTETLVSDLRRVTAYASRVGLLEDKEVLANLQLAEQATQSEDKGNFHVLTVALNGVVRAIAPITLADLLFGRDPMSEANQRRARKFQLWLTGLALIVLILIGYFMQSLRNEQDAIHTLNQIQELHPQLKLTALRKLAQFEKPFERPNTAYETYHHKANELMQINSKLMLSYNGAVAAHTIPLFPSADFIKAYFQPSKPALTSGSAVVAAPPASSSSAVSPDTNQAATGASAGARPSAEPPSGVQMAAPMQEVCVETANGAIKLPPETANYPVWMKNVLSDSFNDFCFQLKVLAPAGQGALLNESMTQLNFVPEIKQKVALRVNWFLPFFYGVLGSIIFVMRNIASVRTPAVEWFPTIMRIALGGVAGIVIGWFGALAAPSVETSTSLSVPFALAFLTGYGIEMLFNLLDRLIRAVSDQSIPKRA